MAINPHDYADARDIPRYSVHEIALYLRIAPSTIRNWVKPQRGRVPYEPLIIPASGYELHGDPTLSFFNAAECYVLGSLRLGQNVKFSKIRAAIDWLKATYPVSHPLISHQFFTDGVDVFVKKLLGNKLRTINASKGGQIAIDQFVNPYLARIQRDEKGAVNKIFPSVPSVNSPCLISISHAVSAGRPVVESTGVRTAVLWSRSQAGGNSTRVS